MRALTGDCSENAGIGVIPGNSCGISLKRCVSTLEISVCPSLSPAGNSNNVPENMGIPAGSLETYGLFDTGSKGRVMDRMIIVSPCFPGADAIR